MTQHSSSSPPAEPCVFPYCPFYFEDFLKSPKVIAMSDAEFRDYVNLLGYEWLTGWLVNDISAIARICARDLTTMKRDWKNVSKCFFQDPSDPTKLLNKRMEIERQKCLIAKQKRIERARSGGFGKSQKHPQPVSSLLEADSKQSFSKEKAARKQCLSLLRASDSLSERESNSVQRGKGSRGKPLKAAKRPARADALFHKNVEAVIAQWSEAFPRDHSLNSARVWIARRLCLVASEPGVDVRHATLGELRKAVRGYAEEQASYKRIHNETNPAQYKARNFFDHDHNYVFDYLSPEKKARKR